jgi:hypothetical protein
MRRQQAEAAQMPASAALALEAAVVWQEVPSGLRAEPQVESRAQALAQEPKKAATLRPTAWQFPEPQQAQPSPESALLV